MRVVSSVESGGVEYQSIWASLSWIEKGHGNSAMALTVRNGEGINETIIHRNAKLAEVEASLHVLRGLGLSDLQLSQLFNHKGKSSGLAQHVKVLVANLR